MNAFKKSYWQEVKLGEIAEIRLSNIDKKTRENELPIQLCNYTDVYRNAFIDKYKSVDFMNASCTETQYERFLLKKGQVAITKDSETPDDIGIPTYIAESFDNVVLGYHCSLIIPNEEKLDGRFLYYYLQTKHLKTYFENNAGGSGQRCSLTIGIQNSTPVTLPSLIIQKSIAKVLSDLDAKIEVNNRINEELESLAKTIYDYWFVQFDFPNQDGKPYKSSGGKMVYNEKLKREIPEGWEVKEVKEIAETGSGGTPTSTNESFYKDGQIPWVNSGELNEPFLVSTKNFITEEGLKNSSTKLFPKDTILMAMYGATAGKTSIASFETTTNQAICAIIPEKEEFRYYLKFALDDLYKYLVNLSSGSARDNLSQTKIKDLKIIISEDSILMEYHKISEKLFKKIENNLLQNQELSALRDWLLPMLMNGQVRVERSDSENFFFRLKKE